MWSGNIDQVRIILCVVVIYIDYKLRYIRIIIEHIAS